MSTQHTPGPWVYYSGSKSVYSEAGKAICITCGPTKTPTDSEVMERKANARLIAAAPDLLAALIGLDHAFCAINEYSSREERYEARRAVIAARSAIAKATGSAA